MASEDEYSHRGRNSVDLVESSILDTIIPASTDFDLEEALSKSSLSGEEHHVTETPLSHIIQRQSLFFDETVDVYVVLQTPLFDEHALRSYLARLVIILEAQVVGVKADNHEGPPPHETIYSASVQEADKDDPFIIVQQAEEQDAQSLDGHIVVVWKLPVQLNRPQRSRPQSPSITFCATATLKSNNEMDTLIQDDEYMPSQLPAGLNLLASFSNHESTGTTMPYLSSTRVTKMLPSNRVINKNPLRHLKNNSRRVVRIFPAFTARVRYAKSNSTPSNPSVIASLDIDPTPYAGQDITFESVDFKVVDGIVNDLNSTELVCPIQCYPLDNLTLLYHLLPSELNVTKAVVRPVHISITARITVSPACKPLVSFNWTTSIDFSIPVNPGFASTTTATTSRENRPSNLSITSSTFDTLPTLAASKPNALANNEAHSKHVRTNSMPDFGVTITFTTPASPSKVGKHFTWEAFVVNRSDRARKLALVVLPHYRRPAQFQSNRPTSTQGIVTNKLPPVADAVIDASDLENLVLSSKMTPTELICLDADISVGPLAVGACQSLTLRFLPLKCGVLSLDCIRVIDTNTREHVDIRELPDVFVVEEEL